MSSSLRRTLPVWATAIGLVLAFCAVPAEAQISNGGFEIWDGTQIVDHDNAGAAGTYDGTSTSQWNAVWGTFGTYSSANEAVAWLRMEQRNLDSPGVNATIVNPLAGENTGTYVNDNFLPSEGLSAWQAVGSLDVKSSYYEPQDTSGGFDHPVGDNYSLDLSCTRGGGVQQTFQVTPGQTYTVQFDMSANMYGNAGPRRMLVQVGAGQKSTYTDDSPGVNDNGIYGNFVPLALGNYSNVQVDDQDTTVDGDTGWQALTAAGGSQGTRAGYNTISVTDATLTSGTNLTDAWGTSRAQNTNIFPRDADSLTPTAQTGLTGLVFWFDWEGTAGSGFGSAVTPSNADWTTLSFDFFADPDLLGQANGNPDNELTLTFLSLEGNLAAASNQGPALDDVSVVPEPATMSLLALGALGMLARRRRRRSA